MSNLTLQNSYTIFATTIKKLLQAGTRQAKIQFSGDFGKGDKQWKAAENRDLWWDVSDSRCWMFLMVENIKEVQKCVPSSKRIQSQSFR